MRENFIPFTLVFLIESKAGKMPEPLSFPRTRPCMTANNSLETKGSLFSHPPADLIIELRQAKLSGALKLDNENQKAIVYFNGGNVVFAVSNSKAIRLFNFLLRKEKIDTKIIAKFPNFANDVEFSSSLIKSGLLSREDCDQIFLEQVEAILRNLVTWTNGTWSFSPLVRVRETLYLAPDLERIMIEYGRTCSKDIIIQRMGQLEESFASFSQGEPATPLSKSEMTVFSRVLGSPKTIAEILTTPAVTPDEVLQALYSLWLGGVIVRSSLPGAFSVEKIGEIRTASLSKVKTASEASGKLVFADPDKPAEAAEEQPAKPEEKLQEITITVEQFVERVQTAVTHYDILGLPEDATAKEIKGTYFALAKAFHPDRYHRESEKKLKNIQSAFTALAHAYETLKTQEGREAYDAKMYKEIEIRKKRKASGLAENVSPQDRQTEQGLESFEEGIRLLNDDDAEAAVVYLARAVHYSPQNPLYHAYYGKALSDDKKQKHKAEAEFQAAVKLDPTNSKIRIMLVEFLIEMNMSKRAEGELKRFLETVPGDRDARALLAKLQQQQSPAG